MNPRDVSWAAQLLDELTTIDKIIDEYNENRVTSISFTCRFSLKPHSTKPKSKTVSVKSNIALEQCYISLLQIRQRLVTELIKLGVTL